MKMLDALVRRPAQPEERSWGFDPRIFMGPYGWGHSQPTQTDGSFQSMIDSVHRTNGIVSAAVMARAALMSQVRFRWRRGYTQTKQGELWGDRSLSVLERPGTYTRAELLTRLEVDVCYAGNAYVVREGDRLRRLAPDRVSFILRSASTPEWQGDSTFTTIPYDAEKVGIVYHPERHGAPAEVFAVGDFAHWAPEPDPVNWWRGESWVTAVLREVTTDGQAVSHTSKFFDNAATPNLVVKLPADRTSDEMRAFAEKMNALHTGTDNAYKTLYLAGGSDVQVVGSTIEQLQMKDLMGGFETRIAARARIPGVILGIREGYQGSSLNAGNYGSARRMWADGWFTPTVESLCSALESIVPPPGGSELHFDPAAILFLQEDQSDAAAILQTQAVTMRQLVEAGFEPSTVIDAVTTGDMTKLSHTGNVSVQLQPPGSGGTPNE